MQVLRDATVAFLKTDLLFENSDQKFGTEIQKSQEIGTSGLFFFHGLNSFFMLWLILNHFLPFFDFVDWQPY